MTEVFETSLSANSSMTAYGTQIDQIYVPVCAKNSVNNTNPRFTSQASTFYYTCNLLYVLFCQLVPVKVVVGTQLSSFQNTD